MKKKPFTFTNQDMVVEGKLKEEDKVNQPAHYINGKIECIDVIDTVTKDLPGELGFYEGTIMKYIWRWSRKNGVEDLKKARWYLNRLINKLDPTDKGV